MENLSDELIETIISWVPPVDMLQSATLVNKYFARLIEQHWTSPEVLQQSGVVAENRADEQQVQSLTTHQLQRCCVFRYSAFSSRPGTPLLLPEPTSLVLPSCLRYASVLPTKQEARAMLDRGMCVCVASTTDHAREAVENVLEHPRYENETTWWSSKPSPTTESNETLLFTTKYPLALLSKLRIKPLPDPYRSNDRLCYTWKTTIIRAYRLPLESLMDPNLANRDYAGFPCVFAAPEISAEDLSQMVHGRANGIMRRILQDRNPPARLLLQLADDAPASDDGETIERLIGSLTPVWELRDSNVPPNSDDVIEYELSTRERSVVANVITITFMGKNHEQHAGSGYYACVERVECDGIPLYESREQSWQRAALDGSDETPVVEAAVV